MQYYKKKLFPHTNSLVCTVCFVVLDIYTQVCTVGNNNNSQHAIIYETSSSRAQEPNLITSFSFKCSPTSLSSADSSDECPVRNFKASHKKKSIRIYFMSFFNAPLISSKSNVEPYRHVNCETY